MHENVAKHGAVACIAESKNHQIPLAFSLIYWLFAKQNFLFLIQKNHQNCPVKYKFRTEKSEVFNQP